MPSDGVFAFGDVVLVPFPFTDQTATKRRPAVVISTLGYNERHPDIVLMPVTSQMRADARPDDTVIDQWEDAGLLKPSAIKPVIATLEQSLVIRSLGKLAEADRVPLGTSLRAILGAA